MIKRLMKIGVMASLSQTVDFDIATIIAAEFNVETKSELDLAEEIFADVCEDPSAQITRPPVVTIMGGMLITVRPLFRLHTRDQGDRYRSGRHHAAYRRLSDCL